MMNRLRKCGWLAIAAGACAFLVSGCPNPNAIVVFEDPNLQQVVQNELGLPLALFVTQADMLDLRVLDARSRNITSLDGLQFAPNLQWLDASNNNISDLTPLTTLVNLTHLDLAVNDISDIEPLAGLYNLSQVYLMGNQAFSASPLVTNALNRGAGEPQPVDMLVVVDEDTFVDEDGNLDPAIERLVNEFGVTVVFATEAS